MQKNVRPEMSKGSWYRPVDKERYDRNYEKIFGKPKKKRNIRDECAFGKNCYYTCGDCLIGEVIEVIG